MKRFASRLLLMSLTIVAILAAAPGIVHALTKDEPTQFDNPIGTNTLDLKTLILTYVGGLMGLLGLATVIMVIYGGYLYLFSAGNEVRIAHGKKTIVWALVGMAVIMLSASIANFVLHLIPQ